MSIEKVIYLSLITASISYTVTETKLFKSVREWIKGKSYYFGELLCCGYCFGHWVSFALVIIYKPRLFVFWEIIDYFLTALVVAWLSAFQWLLMCWLMKKLSK